MIKTFGFARKSLTLGVSSVAMLVSLAAPAFAQTAQAGDTTAPAQVPGSAAPDASNPGSQQIQAQRDNTDQTQTNDGSNEVVVTGSLLRRTSTETPSPVTVLTSDTLAKAGINNVNDAIRSISADSSGSISTGFQNGFSAGGAAVSLRGLGVSSTLILIDGQRSANFPLNDDGHNAYVDLNSIPFSIVDRVEVLKDSASSSYGADAIGGVVNVILKKHFNGIAGQVEGGASQRGDAGRYRANLTLGYGDYDTQGFNVYVNGEYQRDNAVTVQDRGFPYNTLDLTSIGGQDQNRADDSFGTNASQSANAVVRAITPNSQYNPNNPLSGFGTAIGQYQTLNTGNCAAGTFTVAGAAGGVGCRHDNTFEYAQILPKQQRYSANGKISFKLGDDIEGFVEGIYSHSEVLTRGAVRPVRATQPFGASGALASSNPGITLPVFVCSAGVNCNTAADRTLNPNNPFATLGDPARLYYLFGDLPQYTDRNNDLYRIAGGINGSLGNGYNFRVEGVYAKDNFQVENHGNINVTNLLNAINTGAYNFVNPAANSQAVRDFVAPVYTTKSYTALASVDASISKSFIELPGGPLQVLIGGQVRRENLNNRSNNPFGTVTIPGGTAFASPLFYTANTSAAQGRHTVAAGYFEIDAPLLRVLEVNGSGRYDHYSEGFGRFSPKIGAKFTPIPELALRGTYSQGFRAPTFAENGNASYAGFSNYSLIANSPAFVAAHGGSANPYNATYGLGTALASNPALQPERSRSFTAGAIIQPLRWLSLTADYFNIRKNSFIVGGALSATAKNNYYAAGVTGGAAAACAAVAATGPGYSCNQVDAVDPLFPNALPRLLILNAPFTNEGSQRTSGVDGSITANVPLGNGIKFISRLEATYTINLDLVQANGVVQKYAGTLGPYELSSGAGTPRVRGNWQNTVEAGPASLSATLYYVSRIKEVAADENAAVNGVIDLSCATNLYDGSANSPFCYIRPYYQLNLNASVRVNDSFTFTFNVINALDAHAPLAPASYSGTNYLPTWHLDGVIGRAFRAGANFKF